jgi:hypothetical protein
MPTAPALYDVFFRYTLGAPAGTTPAPVQQTVVVATVSDFLNALALEAMIAKIRDSQMVDSANVATAAGLLPGWQHIPQIGVGAVPHGSLP